MLKLFKIIIKKLTNGGSLLLHQALRFRKHHKGGILIEFAFSIPVCISLLFLVSDHYRFHELQNRLRTSAYLAASMLQHITNNRSDKQLTKRDFANISYASCLNFFHTNTMFNPWPFGVYCVLACYWVKRVNSNNYKWQHCYGTTSTKGTSPAGMNQACRSIVTKSLSQIEAMHPDLVCSKDGEERVLIEIIYRNATGFDKKKLGFFFLEPKVSKPDIVGDPHPNSFIYYLVITPKPGLFPARD